MDARDPMHLLIVSDAWLPQVNGVVRTLQNTQAQLEATGHRVSVVGPDRFRTIPCPGYSEIRLSIGVSRRLRRLLDQLTEQGLDCVHIATEGPLGWAARSWCLKHGIGFTTSCHTRFPEYIRLRAPIPVNWTYHCLRRFHGAATRTLVRSRSQLDDLRQRGFKNLAIWPGGVDTELFRPRPKSDGYDRPVALYVGRVSAEKSVEDFLKAPFAGTKVVVGDGPERRSLQARYPEVIFTGYRHGEELAQLVADADVFVFPSRTDTLGLVMLEAMASGVPVAAYPVPGPIDVVSHGKTGVLDENLSKAMSKAIGLSASECRALAETYSWTACSEQFLALLQPIQSDRVQLRNLKSTEPA
jgi:glycosyltransferase involved in cell wall biosynthesis